MSAENNPRISSPQANSEPAVSPVTGIPIIAPEYNGVDRNAFLIGWNPQQELWNGRLAMIGFVAYLIWDWTGFSVVRDVFHLMH